MWISSNLDISQILILKTLRTGRRGGLMVSLQRMGQTPLSFPRRLLGMPGGPFLFLWGLAQSPMVMRCPKRPL